MNRREMLVAMLQALLLSLFPWLRTERGVLVAAEAAESLVPVDMAMGSWAAQAYWHMCRSYNFTWTSRGAELGARMLPQRG